MDVNVLNFNISATSFNIPVIYQGQCIQNNCCSLLVFCSSGGIVYRNQNWLPGL